MIIAVQFESASSQAKLGAILPRVIFDDSQDMHLPDSELIGIMQ